MKKLLGKSVIATIGNKEVKGTIYDVTSGSIVWVETKEDVYKVNRNDVKIVESYLVVYRTKGNTLATQRKIYINAKNQSEAKKIAKNYISKENTILYAEKAMGMINTIN